MLLAPLNGKCSPQLFERHLRFLPSIKNRFHDIRRQERESENPAHVGCANLLSGGDLFNTSIVPVLQQLAPPEGARQCFYQRLVGFRQRCHSASTLRQNNPFAPAVATESHGHMHSDTVLCNSGAIRHHAASLVSDCSSLIRLITPLVRRRMSAPSGDRSTRSTKSWVMRACSPGKSSSHSGSNWVKASRTSASVRSGISLRPSRHVPTMISGARKSWRTC